MNFVKALIPAYITSTGARALETHLAFLNEFREGSYPGLYYIYRG